MAFAHKKSLGQYFLTNPLISKKIADAGEVGKSDIVFEIGPGEGALTRELLARGAHVVAAEADPRAIASLKQTFAVEMASGQLRLIEADMRTSEPKDFGFKDHGYKAIANIPYYLSGMLFRTLLQSQTQPSTIVFLVQKEVAERIARDPKESLLSLSIKAYGKPSYVATVKKGNFTPQPKVDSAILAVCGISRESFRGVTESFFFDMLRLSFRSRRKQLLGTMAERFKKETLINIFSTLGIPHAVRAEDIPVETWMLLAAALEHSKNS